MALRGGERDLLSPVIAKGRKNGKDPSIAEYKGWKEPNCQMSQINAAIGSQINVVPSIRRMKPARDANSITRKRR